MLFLFLFMGVLIFSSLVFVFENDHQDTTFITMLDAYWWALITMTTVLFTMSTCLYNPCTPRLDMARWFPPLGLAGWLAVSVLLLVFWL